MNILDIVTFKNKRGHLLYGRVNGITEKATTIRVIGFKGRNAIRRVRQPWKIAMCVMAISLKDMAIHNQKSAEITAASSKGVSQKRADYWRMMNKYTEKPGHATPLDAADRMARESA